MAETEVRPLPKKREKDVHIFFSDHEMEMLEEKMKDFGVRNRSAFIRQMALDGYCIQLDLPELRKMTTLLHRCSNNLNQYAKMANATGAVYRKDMESVRKDFDGIRECADKILASLMQIPGIRV